MDIYFTHFFRTVSQCATQNSEFKTPQNEKPTNHFVGFSFFLHNFYETNYIIELIAES